MFNQFLEMNEENADIIIANSLIENLKFIIISLDIVFKEQIGEEFFSEDYTFYFYHLQNAFTSCGNIINVLSSDLLRPKQYNYRAKYLQKIFDVSPKEYKYLFNKDFRNANEHFDERYDMFDRIVGDYNIITNNTRAQDERDIMSHPHIRTLDIRKWIYITYDKRGKQICCDLQALRNEAYSLLSKISGHPRISQTPLTHIPTKEILK